MFIYYSLNQAQSVLQGNPQYKGPDFFLVKDVDGTKPRRSWIVWEEDGKYPNLIVELLSPSTAQKDREEKKQLYAKVFHTPEYFWYDAFTGELAGFCLHEEEYIPIEPNEQGWLWSHQLGAYFGVWEGVYHRRKYRWLRLYTAEGELIPTDAELRRQAQQLAEAERQRAERLAQRLRELGIDPDAL
jgi:Uma2 family endonuclease